MMLQQTHIVLALLRGGEREREIEGAREHSAVVLGDRRV